MLKAIPYLLLIFFLISCNNNIENKIDIGNEVKHYNQFEHNEKNTEIKKNKQKNFSLDREEEKMLENLLDF